MVNKYVHKTLLMKKCRAGCDRVRISLAVLQLRESGDLQKLHNKWWYGKGECAPENDGKVCLNFTQAP